MTATQLIERATGAGMVLTVNGGKLNVKGNRGPQFDELVTMIKAVRDDVIKALTPPPPQLWDLPAFDAPPAVRNPAYDAPVTADMLNDAELFDVGQLAYYKQFVGQVVTDEQMTELYMAAHRNGFKLTSEARGEWWKECNYRVTAARFA